MTKISRSLIKQNGLCSRTFAMTLNAMSSNTFELKGTTRYSPNSKCIYDLAEDGDQISSPHSARSISEDYTQTATSLKYSLKIRTLHWWRIPPPTFALMLRPRSSAPTLNSYPGRRYCILTQTRCHCTCYHIRLRRVHIEWNHQHAILHVWSWLSATRRTASRPVSLKAFLQLPDHPD